jgi:hypothetical protein
MPKRVEDNNLTETPDDEFNAFLEYKKLRSNKTENKTETKTETPKKERVKKTVERPLSDSRIIERVVEVKKAKIKRPPKNKEDEESRKIMGEAIREAHKKIRELKSKKK